MKLVDVGDSKSPAERRAGSSPASGTKHQVFLDMKAPMEIHRIVLYVVDFDGLGAEGVKQELENTRFANDCISPDIAEVQTRDIGEWSDAHPLNHRATAQATREALFASPQTPKSS